MVFAAIFKWGCIIAVVMTNPKDPNSPPIPVPETMEEFREMAREAMASVARFSAAVDKDRETRAEERRQDREELRKHRERRETERREYRERREAELREYRERQEAELREYRKAREAEERKWREGREEEWRKTEEAMREIGVVSGRHAENTGRLLEQELIAQVERDGKIAWMAADEIFPRLKRRVKRRVVDEFDLFIVNGEEAMLVEVKRVLRAGDVRQFAETDLESFRRHFAGMVGDRVLYGALAFALEDADEEVREQVRKKAEDAGILLIHLVGESNMKILNPDREKLRAVAP